MVVALGDDLQTLLARHLPHGGQDRLGLGSQIISGFCAHAIAPGRASARRLGRRRRTGFLGRGVLTSRLAEYKSSIPTEASFIIRGQCVSGMPLRYHLNTASNVTGRSVSWDSRATRIGPPAALTISRTLLMREAYGINFQFSRTFFPDRVQRLWSSFAAMTYEWARRLKQRAKEFGWSAQKLSDESDVPLHRVNKFLQGRVANPRGDAVARLARALKTTEKWLRGYETSESINVETTPNLGFRSVTLYSLKDLFPTEKNSTVKGGTRSVTVPDTVGPNAFGVTVEDNSMEGVFNEGDISS